MADRITGIKKEIPSGFPFFILFVVAVTIAILAAGGITAFAEIDSIKHRGQFGESGFGAERVDIGKAGFGRDAGPANIEAEIGAAGDDVGVGHDANRGGVEQDVVVLRAESFDQGFQGRARYEFRRIRRDGTTG